MHHPVYFPICPGNGLEISKDNLAMSKKLYKQTLFGVTAALTIWLGALAVMVSEPMQATGKPGVFELIGLTVPWQDPTGEEKGIRRLMLPAR